MDASYIGLRIDQFNTNPFFEKVTSRARFGVHVCVFDQWNCMQIMPGVVGQLLRHRRATRCLIQCQRNLTKNRGAANGALMFHVLNITTNGDLPCDVYIGQMLENCYGNMSLRYSGVGHRTASFGQRTMR